MFPDLTNPMSKQSHRRIRIFSHSLEAAKEIAEMEGNKRKLNDARAAAVISSYQEHKKLKESDYAAAIKETIDRKDVLDKLQAVAERQEFLRLRQEVKTLNQTIIQLQQQSIESDNRVMEAITDRRVTLNECKNLREINAQLKTELRRMVLLFEHSGGSNANSSALMQAATQGANVELMQARLTESELRYHTVTESLSRQTGVLTDQHRAILELNNQLEKERAKRQRVEFELKELKKSVRIGKLMACIRRWLGLGKRYILHICTMLLHTFVSIVSIHIN